ncbi:hypothetical protein DPMN_079791 [Dreissena polymorpha]|uniref:Uncharacterized protein n=1 Tax=Dreissena polymorpha TaxID=45954 RepID=A0A9D3YPM9_DREPO|nr:hypothetical protein DPMN_079791 [Dreissena polymorpha]
MDRNSLQCKCVVILAALVLISGLPIEQDPVDADIDGNQQQTLMDMKRSCFEFCFTRHMPCPLICRSVLKNDAFNLGVDKRSLGGGIDGFTFDDYLFLRWLGRDLTQRSRLYK